MRGVAAIAGRGIGVAFVMLGVALGILGGPDGWLCWLPLADVLTAIGADMGGWGCTTEGGLGGLAATFDVDRCIDALLAMGEDTECGVPWRTTGDDTGA